MSKAKTTETLFHAMPGQVEFLRATEEEVLASGGYASGKSAALLVACVQSVSGKPGAKALLARRFMAGLKKTTLPMLLKSSGDLPPILPLGSYEYLETKDLIRLYGGGEICLAASDQPIKVMSLNCSDLFVDEAVEMEDKDLYDGLVSRIRIPTGTGYKRLATNPAHTGHWLYRHFSSGVPTRRIIYSNALDNPHITSSYRAWLAAMAGDDYLRKCLGQWTARGLMVWPAWDPNTMVRPQDQSEAGEYIIGVDYGQTHATGIIACRIGPDGVLRVLAELYGPGKTFREILQWMEQWRKFDPQIVYDPSARSIKTEFEAAGWSRVNHADNDVQIGIARVSDRIGANAIQVDPSCRYLQEEMLGYQWDGRPGHEGKPVKERDDLVDPLRYVCLECSRNLASGQEGCFIFA